MMIRSLRFRLAAGALISIAVALSLVWFVLSNLFEDYVADQYTSEMVAVSDALAARLTADNGSLALASEPSDPRFQIPAGGRYWEISPNDGREPLRSRSLWDVELSRASFQPDLYCGFFQAIGPDGGTILVSEQEISIGEGTRRQSFHVYTAFSKADMDAALAGYHRPLFLMLLATGSVLLLAAFLQGAIGLRPLSRLQRDVAKIRAGLATSIATGGPTEIGPVVSELNLLLAERETAVERARARASDLAHGLKTPLTVLSQLAEVLPDHERGTALQQIELVRQRADRQLQAARMGVESMITTSLLSISGKLINVLTPVSNDKGVSWVLNIPEDLSVQADPADVAEAIGNILDNAVRFAHRKVELSAARDGNMIALRVCDDGPGISQDRHPFILQRGVSDDPASSNSGLGLAISSDIAAAYGGSVKLATAKLGGLEAIIRFPAEIDRHKVRRQRETLIG